jgi:hypothetical protein
MSRTVPFSSSILSEFLIFSLRVAKIHKDLILNFFAFDSVSFKKNDRNSWIMVRTKTIIAVLMKEFRVIR